MSASRAQCLLFIVYPTDDEGTRKLRNTSTSQPRSSAVVHSSAPKAYALFSEVFSKKRPEVLALFEQNNVRTLSNENASSLSLLGDCQLEIVELLLEESPSASVDPLSGITNYPDREVIILLFCTLTIRLRPERGITSVRPAIDAKNFEVMKYLMLQKADTLSWYQKEVLLYFAASRGPESLFRLMVKYRKNIVVQGDPLPKARAYYHVPKNDKTTALHLAAKAGHTSAVRLLIENGISVDQEDVHRHTALYIASKRGHLDVVKILLSSGASVDCKDARGETALHVASKEGHSDVAEVLLLNGIPVDCKNTNGHTALHHAVEMGRLGVVEILLQNAADVNSRSKSQRTPVFAAVLKGHYELVDMLLKYGALVNAKDGQKASVLSEAFKLKSPKMFQYLLENYFPDLELLKESAIVQVVLKIVDNMNGYYYYYGEHKRAIYRNSSEILARHIIKTATLHLVHDFDVARLWPNHTALSTFKFRCEAEVSRLKALTVGDTNFSFFDILAKDLSKVACCLRNSSVAQIAVSDELQEKFPIYGSILTHHFQKGKERKELVEESLKICNFLFCHFKKLPDEIKERILSCLNFKDLRILIKTCGHLIVSH